MAIGKYIYGILNSNASLHLSIPKDLLSGESEPRPCPAPASRGGACTQERGKSNGVYTIAYQDISVLVRDSEIVDTSTSLSINGERSRTIDYTHMRKDILARLLVGHQTVIERVMTRQTTIIPMRLGTFVQDETEVKEILNKGYNLIKQIFEKIRDRIEIDLAATFSDFESVLKEIAQEREIKESKEGLLANPKGITVDDQMKVGSMLKKALDERRDKFAKEIQDNLKTFCLDFKTHELMDDKMVINSAFLIDKDKWEGFDKKVEELNAKFNEKLNFRCVGPLPPYSFYTLEIKIVKNEDIDWAKKKLGILNDITGKDEIKKAYQRQVFSTHPDKNPNNPYAEKEFDEVNRAHKILSDYCVALQQANPVRDKKSLNGTNPQDNVPFDREMFSPPQRDPATKKDKEAGKQNIILVRVRE